MPALDRVIMSCVGRGAIGISSGVGGVENGDGGSGIGEGGGVGR